MNKAGKSALKVTGRGKNSHDFSKAEGTASVVTMKVGISPLSRKGVVEPGRSQPC